MPTAFHALEVLKGEGLTQTQIRDFEHSLEPIQELCVTHEIFFDALIAPHAESDQAFRTYVIESFKEHFPDKGSHKHIIAAADVAYQIFIGRFFKHKDILKKLEIYSRKALAPDASPDVIRAEFIDFLTAHEVTNPNAVNGYMNLYDSSFQRAHSKLRLSEIDDSLSEDEQMELRQEAMQSNPDILAIVEMAIVECPHLEPIIREASVFIPNDTKVVGVLNASKKDPDGVIGAFLTNRVREYKAMLQREKARKNAQIAWLQEYRVDLVKSLSDTVNAILGGAASAAANVYYALNGFVEVGQIEALVDKANLWDAYEPTLKPVMEIKMEAVNETIPRVFQEIIQDEDFTLNLVDNTDLIANFENNLLKLPLNIDAVKSQLELIRVGHDIEPQDAELPRDLIDAYLTAIDWSEIRLTEPFNLHEGLFQLRDAVMGEVGEKKYPLRGINPSDEYYKNYTNFNKDYVAPLMFFGVDGCVRELNVKWLRVWKNHFYSNSRYRAIKDLFLSKTKSQQESILEDNTKGVLSLVNDFYHLDPVAEPQLVADMCEDWLAISGAKLTAFKGTESVRKVVEYMNDVSTLTATLGHMKGAIEAVKENESAFEAWGLLTDSTQTLWNGFKTFTDSMGLLFAGIGGAFDVPVAWYKTSKYKATKGEKAWREASKEIPILGAFYQDFSELRAESGIPSDRNKYLALQKEYEDRLKQYTDPTSEECHRVQNHIKRYQYAASKLLKKYIHKLLDFIGKINNYISLILTLIPTGITQLIAGFIGLINGIITVVRGIVRGGRKVYKFFRGELGKERDKVAKLLVEDIFDTDLESTDNSVEKQQEIALNIEFRTEAIDLMWRAGVYKIDEIENILTGQSVDLNPLRPLDAKENLNACLKVIRNEKDQNLHRYMTLRILLRRFMKGSLRLEK